MNARNCNYTECRLWLNFLSLVPANILGLDIIYHLREMYFSRQRKNLRSPTIDGNYTGIEAVRKFANLANCWVGTWWLDILFCSIFWVIQISTAESSRAIDDLAHSFGWVGHSQLFGSLMNHNLTFVIRFGCFDKPTGVISAMLVSISFCVLFGQLDRWMEKNYY
jgi:hypothetical protein